MKAKDVLFSGFFVCYVGMCGVGYLGMPLIRGVVVLKCVFAFKVPLIAKAQNRGVLKTEYGSVKFNI